PRKSQFLLLLLSTLGQKTLISVQHLIRSMLLSLRLRRARPLLIPYTTLFRSRVAPRWLPLSALVVVLGVVVTIVTTTPSTTTSRSEEHTSELQSRENLVCRLLLEKKKTLYDCFVFDHVSGNNGKIKNER